MSQLQSTLLQPKAEFIVFASKVNPHDLTAPSVPIDNIWIMKSDGSGLVAVTKNTLAGRASNSSVTFSDDGKHLVFHSLTSLDKTWDGFAPASNNIWIADVGAGGAVSNLRPLTQNSIANADSTIPVIAKGHIYFASKMALDGIADSTPCGKTNLWRMNKNGTDLRNVTGECSLDPAVNAVTVSADGKFVVFKAKLSVEGVPSSSFNVWVYNTQTETLTAITKNTNPGLDVDNVAVNLAGTAVVFTSKMSLSGAWNDTPSIVNNVWVVRIDGSQIQAITRNTLIGRGSVNPAFSPDGSKVAFQSNMNLNAVFDDVASAAQNVFVADLSSGSLIAISQNVGVNNTAAAVRFTMDNKRVVYSSFANLSGVSSDPANPGSNIWMADISGLKLTPVTRLQITGSDMRGYGQYSSQLIPY